MAEIPGASALGGVPSGRSGRGIARMDTSAAGAGAMAVGAALQNLGQSSLALADTVAKKAQQVETFQIQARFLDWQQRTATAYTDEMRNLPADQLEGYAAGFVDPSGGFYEQGRAFMDSIPERLRPEYNTRLMSFRNDLFDTANTYALDQLNRISITTTQDAVDAIINQVPAAAAAPDPVAAAAILTEQARSVITGAPHLTQAQQAEALSNATRNINSGLISELIRTGQYDLVDQLVGADPVAMSARVLDAAGGAAAISDGQWVSIAGDVLRSGMSVNEIEVFDADPTTARSSILAARNDPDVVAEVAARVQETNSRALATAGIEATPGNLMLAQALGPWAAVIVSRQAETNPDARVADVLPASVIAASPEIAGMTVGEAAAWAERTVTGTAAYGHRMAAGLTLDDRAAFIADNNRARTAAATAATASANAQRAGLLNQLLVDIHDGSAGMAQINAARQAGWLTDFDDIKKAEDAYKARNAATIDASEGLRLMGDPSYQFSSFNTDDRDRVDAAYVAMGGTAALLDPNAAPEAQTQATTVLRAVVDRTGIIPQTALEALQGGMYSTNEGVRESAFRALDALVLDNPTAVNNALNDQQYGRLLDWQALSPLMTASELSAHFSPTINPQEQARRDRLRQEGRDFAADIPLGEVVNHFIRGTFGAGQDSYPIDDAQALALQDDFTAAYAERYAMTGNEQTAKEQAFEMLARKWGITDTGNTRRVMAYPPEQVYGPVGGTFEWLKTDIEGTLEAATGMDASGLSYGLIAAPGLIEGELPRYFIQYLDRSTGEIGMLMGDNRQGYIFDREAALAAWRQTFDADRAASQQPAPLLFGPNGEIIPNPAAPLSIGGARSLPDAQPITTPTAPTTGGRALPGAQQIGTPVEGTGGIGPRVRVPSTGLRLQ
jgi:hypothetical protein